MKLIDKSTLVAEIMSRIDDIEVSQKAGLIKKRDAETKIILLKSILSLIDTLEVIDPYDKFIQYQSVEDGIRAHAETYSFNIESELFNQLTKEQQALWRKEIEQACISGGDVGVELARDIRYKENVEVKEVDLEKERIKECPFKKVGCEMYEGHILECKGECSWVVDHPKLKELKAQKGEEI